MLKKSISIVVVCLQINAAGISDANKQVLLEKAILNNDRETIFLLLKAGLSSNLLAQALTNLNNNRETISFLLEAGYNPDSLAQVLANQIMGGNLDMAKFILESGAKINLDLCIYGNSKTNVNNAYEFKCDDNALNFAIKAKTSSENFLINSDFINNLIEAGANVNQKSSNWDRATPLIYASRMGRADVVMFLISAGADINALDSNENTALLEAAKNNHAEIVKLLLIAKANIEKTNNTSWSAIKLASFYGHYDVTKILIDSGADVNNTKANTQNPCPPLILALMSATSSHFKIAKLLIDAGANINDHLISNVSFRCLGTPLSYCTGLNPTSIIPGKPECEERLALLKFLLSQPNINTEQLIYDFHTKKYLTAYQIAIDRKLLETVKIFDEYYINKLKQ